jgi:hypothetical protein
VLAKKGELMDKNGGKFSFEIEIFLLFYYSPFPASTFFIAVIADESRLSDVTK